MTIIKPSGKFPWWAIPLICLASFSYEYNGAASRSTYNGCGMAVGLLAIIMIFISFSLLDGIQRILLAKKQMMKAVGSRYAMLLPLVFIIPGIGYRALSDKTIKGIMGDKEVPVWELQWGTSPLYGWLIGSFIAFLFLHTLLLIIQEVQRTAEQSAKLDTVSHAA